MNKLKPKKHLGQHFLNDENIAQSITDLLSAEARKVVEIGPGMGVLTKYLLQKDIDLKLVELDKDSIIYLILHFPAIEKSIIEADFLQVDLQTTFDSPFSIIGNFPYNISSQILFTIFDKGKVRAPLPGPISKIISFFFGLNSVMILLIKFKSLIKFCPQRFLMGG